MRGLFGHLLLLCCLFPGFAVWAAGPGGACENPPVLHFSLVPQGDAGKDLAAYQPLLEDIQKRAGIPVDLLLPNSYGAVVEGLGVGHIDFAVLGPASYLKARLANPTVTVFASYAKRAGTFQEEGAFYRSLLITRAAGPYKRLADLQGRTLALTDPGSTSGAVLPRLRIPYLTGQPLEQYFGRVVYVGDHDRAGLAVAAGKVDGAFLSGFHLSELVRHGRLRADEVRVLWRSEPIPQDAIVVRSSLCPALVEAIRSSFLAQEGRAYPALLEQRGNLRFVPMGDEAYRILRELP